MSHYRVGEFVKLVAQEDGLKETERRIINLARSGVVEPIEITGSGFQRTRYYGYKEICELVVAVDLMRRGILTHEIKPILDKYRKCRDDSLVIYGHFTELKISKFHVTKTVKEFLEGRQ